MRERFKESKKKKSFLATFGAEGYATLAWDQAPHWGKRRKKLAWAREGESGEAAVVAA